MSLDHHTYSIADLAAEFQVTARTLRFYEDKGLLDPIRVGQSRQYSEADRVRLSWILRGKRVGFSLAEVGEMLDLYNLDDNRKTQRQVTINKCQEKIVDLKHQRDDIDLTITELEEFVNQLQHLDK